MCVQESQMQEVRKMKKKKPNKGYGDIAKDLVFGGKRKPKK